MVEEDRVRICISLPARIKEMLLVPNQWPMVLAVRCLRRDLKKYRKATVRPAYSCTYNPETCSARMCIWLTENEARLLRSYRIILGLSVSYIFSMAIEKYIAKVLSKRPFDRDRVPKLRISAIADGIDFHCSMVIDEQARPPNAA